MKRYPAILSILSIIVCSLLAFSAHAQQSPKDVARTLIDQVYNKRNAAIVDALFAPDYVRHPDEARAVDFKVALFSLFAAIPDLKATEEVVLEEGNLVAMRLRMRGTFVNEFLLAVNSTPIPPNHRPIDLVINIVFRFNDDGQIVEEWDAFDNLSFLSQMSQDPFLANPVAETMLYPQVVDTGSSAQNREVGNRYFDALNRRDWSFIDTHFKADFAAHNPFGKLDRAGLINDLRSLSGALPDLKASVEQWVAEGNWIAAHYTLSGTFTRDYVLPGGATMPPTNRTLNLPVITFFRFEQQGLVAEYFELYDALSFLAQLGLLQLVPIPTPVL